MGLDLIVEGCAKPGHEKEWRRLLQRSFADEELSDAEVARFHEISIPGYEHIGAPRVGYDNAANQWILDARKAKTPEEIAVVLKEFNGYHVIQLVQCDGVPRFTHAGLYEGADETSFRGAFLNDCRELLGKGLLSDAWNHKFPEQAVDYGKALLAAAEAAVGAPKRRRTLLSRLGLVKESEPLALAEQLEILRAAGRWFIFWGEPDIQYAHGSESPTVLSWNHFSCKRPLISRSNDSFSTTPACISAILPSRSISTATGGFSTE